MNIKKLFDYLENNELVMPDFQRDYVWNKSNQKALIASVILQLPIGSFLLLSGKKDDFATKQIGFATKVAQPAEKCKFLLDGQQRLTSLKSVFSDFFEDENWIGWLNEIYHKLRVRWYLKIKPENEGYDIFGWKNLNFNKQNLRNCEPTEIEDRLIEKNIGKTLSKNWSNPDYQPKNSKNESISEKYSTTWNFYLAKDIAKENLVPLYTIYKDKSRALLKATLTEIAKQRKDELKAELCNNKDEIIRILEVVDPMICEMFDDESFVNSAWERLVSNWVVEVSKYLTELLDETKIDVIDLPSNEISRAVVIFERINRGGTDLDNFDLIVARAARTNELCSLNKRIINYLSEDINPSNALVDSLNYEKPQIFNSKNLETVVDNEIDKLIKKQYLNLLSLLVYVNYGDVEKIKIDYTKKDKILNINHNDINEYTKDVIKALNRACAFLNFRCGIVKINDLNYNLMILPIAYLLKDDEIWNDKAAIAKLEYWYWGSIFSGEYRYSQNDKMINDIKDLYKWIKNGEEIKRYTKYLEESLNVPGYSNKSLLIREDIENDIPTVIHKTILQYMLSNQISDLIYHDVKLNPWDLSQKKIVKQKTENIELTVEDHHIIPLSSEKTIFESTKVIRNDKKNPLNSVLNRTYILKCTNRIFSDEKPIKYLQQITNNENKFVLEEHYITQSYKDKLLQNDSFNIVEFLELRYEKLSSILKNELNKLYNLTN